jgi:hypothetical protein
MYLLGFHAHINKMHGSRRKIPSKKSRQAALLKRLMNNIQRTGLLLILIQNCWIILKIRLRDLGLYF